MRGIVIFTDLDGSLLDHHNYSHAAADGLLAELEEGAIPVIPVSSKTRSELLELRRELGNRHPFIAENGAAVYIPDGYFGFRPAETLERAGYLVREFSQPRQHWLDKLQQVADRFPGDFSSFADLDSETIAEWTGLSLEAARRASQREYGEPIRWFGSETAKADFVATMQGMGATLLQGGRFLHLSGDCDKGRALAWLNRQYAMETGEEPLSIAIGDSQNDAAMLEAADHALIIQSPSHPSPELKRTDKVLISEAFGPQGWNEGVRKILTTIEQTNGTRQDSHG